MREVAGRFVMGMFLVLALFVVFVRAGQFNKNQSGGQQTAEILNAAGSGGANFARGLTGG